ncbi:Zn(2)-C6 fungal-type domain-containing protein [Mycena indigotica]|uniref:Zn(2)-C6 fungal-type domain-containing protein n=1 Tax=Mycena indigotica TaxID=2126181 RepID=A0A8H6WCC3_9AGAR|nr:Zn(2)-C6 fungal-type domain-containing protein [Mycena indigotica]KAF7312677.1 Zn(2)-C6 fungal-type domain-containing protein [Mycena indigotica]
MYDATPPQVNTERVLLGDGEEPCSRCLKYDFTCSYEEKAAKRTSSNYVKSLESRLRTVESLLQQQQSQPPALPPPPKPSDYKKSIGPGVQVVTEVIRNLNSPFPVPHSDDLAFTDISHKLSHLKISKGFHGKSSQAMLVKSIMDLKGCGQGCAPRRQVSEKPWAMRPWNSYNPAKPYIFPEDNLLVSLVTLYFVNVNSFYPLLHRDTFEQSIARGGHLKDDVEFGAVVLLVCALGAQYSSDPRVRGLPPTSPNGHIWFDQVDLVVFSQPTLSTLQSYCLATLYLERTSSPRACWSVVGAGMRLAQDMGSHRERMHRGPISPEMELEKRAYWLLTLMDTRFSAALGRSIAIPLHETDLGLPIRCDDQYWTEGGFAQPPELPSSVDFFILDLKLQRILSYTLKILYTTNRNKRLIGLNDDDWEEPLVVEFDSALNSWFDSIPEHLRWNPQESVDPNALFLDQSAALYCMFYFAQILIHRPFIPASHHAKGPGAKPRTFPSLSVCNNAGRAIARLVDVYTRLRPGHPLICGPTPAFTAGVGLLLNVWGMARNTKQTSGSVVAKGGSSDQQMLDLIDVRRCLEALEAHAAQWPSAAPLADTLQQLLNVDIENAVTAAFPYPPPSGPTQIGRSASPSPFSGPAVDSQMVNDAVAQWSNSNSDHTHSGFTPSQPVDEVELMLQYSFGPGEEQAHQQPTSSSSYADLFAMDVDMNTVAFWSQAPSTFEVSDWGMYLEAMGNAIDHVSTEY